MKFGWWFIVLFACVGCAAPGRQYAYNEVVPETDGHRACIVNDSGWDFTEVAADNVEVFVSPAGWLGNASNPGLPRTERVYVKFPTGIPVGTEVPFFVTAYDHEKKCERTAHIVITIGNSRSVNIWRVTSNDFLASIPLANR